MHNVGIQKNSKQDANEDFKPQNTCQDLN